MNIGSRDQTPRPGILVSAGCDCEQSRGGGEGDQENPERGCREEFQGNLCFFSVAIRCTLGCFVFMVKRKLFVAC